MRTLFGPDAPFASQPQPHLHIFHADAGVVLIPDRAVLLQGFYTRAGVDLVIKTPDGETYVVKGFYLLNPPPELTDGGATHIPGGLASQFAGALAPDQYAAAQPTAQGAPVGQARTIIGQVTCTRLNGTVVTLKVGDPIYMGDIIETGTGAKLGLVFIDGMTLGLGEKGELVLDELVYDPASKGGKASLSLVSGAAEFVSGTIAHSGQDNMLFKTPVGTIGIRGTKVFVSFDPVSGDVSIINRPTGTDTLGNQTAGEIFLSLPDGTPIGSMTSGNGGWQWNPTQGQAPQTVQLTDAQVQTIVEAVENTVSSLQTPQQQQAQQGQGTTDITSQPAGANGAAGTQQGGGTVQDGTGDATQGGQQTGDQAAGRARQHRSP